MARVTMTERGFRGLWFDEGAVVACSPTDRAERTSPPYHAYEAGACRATGPRRLFSFIMDLARVEGASSPSRNLRGQPANLPPRTMRRLTHMVILLRIGDIDELVPA
jgi:hypothetical protein